MRTGIVQYVQPRFLVVLFRLGLLDAVHFRLVHNLDLQVAQFDVDLVEFLRPDEVSGSASVMSL